MTAQQVLTVVATRNRAGSLRDCLRSLEAQCLPPGYVQQVLVVRSGVDAVAVEAETADVVVERAAGIPQARNRGVHEARQRESDFLAFIDDDEVAGDEAWLARLLSTLTDYRADVVTGPVLPRVPPDTPRSVARHPFMRRNRALRTGTRVREAYTNNVLIGRDCFASADFRFDVRLRWSGGSDTELFRRLARDGRAIVWCDEAVVEEPVPADRATVRWILRRSWRVGVNRTERLRMWRSGPAVWAGLLAAVCGEALLGLVWLALSPVSPRLGLVGLGRLTRATGTLAATVGASAWEYRDR